MQCGGPRQLWVLRVCREWPLLPSLVLTHFRRTGISSGRTQEGVTCLRVWGPQSCPCLVRTEDGKLTVHPVFVCKKKKSENKNKYEDYTTETVWMWPAKLEILPGGPFTASACAPSTWMGCEWRESGLSGQSAGVCGAFGWLSPVVCVHTSALSRSNPCGSTFSAPGCRKTPQLLSRGVK